MSSWSFIILDIAEVTVEVHGFLIVLRFTFSLLRDWLLSKIKCFGFSILRHAKSVSVKKKKICIKNNLRTSFKKGVSDFFLVSFWVSADSSS